MESRPKPQVRKSTPVEHLTRTGPPIVARQRNHKRSTKRVIARPLTDIMPTADDAAAAADSAAAALRVLAYATRDSLTSPGDVYLVLGSLVDVAARLPQSARR